MARGDYDGFVYGFVAGRFCVYREIGSFGLGIVGRDLGFARVEIRFRMKDLRRKA